MNNEELRELREHIRLSARQAEPWWMGWTVPVDQINDDVWCYRSLIDIMTLAQLAVLPGDAEPTVDGVTYGEWTELKELPHGALWINQRGEYGQRVPGGLLGDLAVVVFPRTKSTLKAESMKVRQVILPAPVAPPQEPEPPSLEERAWQFIEKMRDYNGWNEAEELLAERTAATQGTAGG